MSRSHAEDEHAEQPLEEVAMALDCAALRLAELVAAEVELDAIDDLEPAVVAIDRP